MKDFEILELKKVFTLITNKSTYWMFIQSKISGRCMWVRIKKEEYNELMEISRGGNTNGNKN